MDPYQVLDLPKSASAEDVKRAFRLKALKHHPDRHQNASQAEKEIAAALFKYTKDAYEVLSDGNRRAIYDKYGSSTATGRSQQASGSTYSQNFYTARDRGYGTYRQRSRPQGGFYRSISALAQGMTRADGAFHLAIAATFLFGFAIFGTVTDHLWERQNEGRLFKHIASPQQDPQGDRESDAEMSSASTAAFKQHPVQQGLQRLHELQEGQHPPASSAPMVETAPRPLQLPAHVSNAQAHQSGQALPVPVPRQLNTLSDVSQVTRDSQPQAPARPMPHAPDIPAGHDHAPSLTVPDRQHSTNAQPGSHDP